MATLLKPRIGHGMNMVVRRGQAGLKLLRFGLLVLEAGKTYRASTGSEELVGVVLSGRCGLACDGVREVAIGCRRQVFAGRAWGFFVSRDCSYELRAVERATVAMVSAPAKEKLDCYVVSPDEVQVVRTGEANWCRDVHNIVGPDRKASRLLVGETFNRPGCWSGSPPHRHEADNYPEEVDLEELYYFKLWPSTGFGVQVVYTDDRKTDQAFVLRDDYTVAIPEGYHPVVAAPGHQIYYLWMMAGEDRRMAPRDDPDHAWLKHCEAILRMQKEK